MNWHFWSRKNPSKPDTCTAIEPLLSLQIDGMASPDEARRIEGHMAVCADCRQAYRWMAATQAALAQRPVVLPPIDMRERIARAIAAASPEAPAPIRPSRRPLVWQPAFAAAMSVSLFAILGYSYWTGHHAGMPSSRPPMVAANPFTEPVSPGKPVITPAPVVSHPRHPAPELPVFSPLPDPAIAWTVGDTPVSDAPVKVHPKAVKPPVTVATASVSKTSPHKTVAVKPHLDKVATRITAHKAKPIPPAMPSLDIEERMASTRVPVTDVAPESLHRPEQPDVAPTPVAAPEPAVHMATMDAASDSHSGLIRLNGFRPAGFRTGVLTEHSRVVNAVSHSASMDMSTDGEGFQPMVASALH